MTGKYFVRTAYGCGHAALFLILFRSIFASTFEYDLLSAVLYRRLLYKLVSVSGLLDEYCIMYNYTTLLS